MNFLIGNKGEWSELYVLIKLLGDGKLYKADAEMNILYDNYYDIRKIIRYELNTKITYYYDSQRINVVVESTGESMIIKIPLHRFIKEKEELYIAIANGTSTFTVPSIEPFLREIKCSKLKADSNSKSDIRVEIYDGITGLTPTLGFSIKSQLGSNSTLLNASKSTNFVYLITGNFNDEDMVNVNSIFNKERISISKRIDHILNLGCKLEYSHTQDPIFENNLQLIDTSLPKILAWLLQSSYHNGSHYMKLAVEELTRINPLGFDMKYGHQYYIYKIKKFLTEVSLGMMPSKVWSGLADANGGYIVIKADGNIVCYHIYDRNLFEEYLLANTKLERPSTERHDFGYIEKINGNYLLKLNLQVRFTS